MLCSMLIKKKKGIEERERTEERREKSIGDKMGRGLSPRQQRQNADREREEREKREETYVYNSGFAGDGTSCYGMNILID